MRFDLTRAAVEAQTCTDLLSQAAHYVSHARKIDEHDREMRRKHRLEREAVVKQHETSKVSASHAIGQSPTPSVNLPRHRSTSHAIGQPPTPSVNLPRYWSTSHATGQPLTAIGQPLTAIGQPPTPSVNLPRHRSTSYGHRSTASGAYYL